MNLWSGKSRQRCQKLYKCSQVTVQNNRTFWHYSQSLHTSVTSMPLSGLSIPLQIVCLHLELRLQINTNILVHRRSRRPVVSSQPKQNSVKPRTKSQRVLKRTVIKTPPMLQHRHDRHMLSLHSSSRTEPITPPRGRGIPIMYHGHQLPAIRLRRGIGQQALRREIEDRAHCHRAQHGYTSASTVKVSHSGYSRKFSRMRKTSCAGAWIVALPQVVKTALVRP